MHGQATSYDGGDVDGTCMFATAGYTLPMGIYGAALSVDNWDTSASCGACVSVTGQDGKSVKLMVSLAQESKRSQFRAITDFSRLLINALVTAV
jgi:hypothetical protein